MGQQLDIYTASLSRYLSSLSGHIPSYELPETMLSKLGKRCDAFKVEQPLFECRMFSKPGEKLVEAAP